MEDIRENLRYNLTYYLRSRNIAQKELAQKLGVTQSAVTNWIKGKNAPDLTLIVKICSFLDISITDLVGIQNASQDSFSAWERDILKKYRVLDQHGRDVVELVLEKEHQRCVEKPEEVELFAVARSGENQPIKGKDFDVDAIPYPKDDAF